MNYRGYTLVEDDPGANGVEIYGQDGALITETADRAEAIRTINEWLKGDDGR